MVAVRLHKSSGACFLGTKRSFKRDAGQPSHTCKLTGSQSCPVDSGLLIFVPSLQVKGLANGLSSVGSRRWSIHCRRIWFVVAVITEGGDPAQQVVKNSSIALAAHWCCQASKKELDLGERDLKMVIIQLMVSKCRSSFSSIRGMIIPIDEPGMVETTQ